MSKKHFIALADEIRRHNSEDFDETNKFNAYHLQALSDWLRNQNPRFNEERWLGYIAGTNGPNGGKVKS